MGAPSTFGPLFELEQSSWLAKSKHTEIPRALSNRMPAILSRKHARRNGPKFLARRGPNETTERHRCHSSSALASFGCRSSEMFNN